MRTYTKRRIFLAVAGCLSLGAVTRMQAAGIVDNWVGGTSGDTTNLNNALNWTKNGASTHPLPTSIDTANFDTAGGGFPTVSTGTGASAGTTSAATFDFNNLDPTLFPGFTGWTVNGDGTLSVNKAIVFDTEFSPNTTGGPTKVTINSNLTFVGGTGSLQINTDAQPNGAQIVINGAVGGTGTGNLVFNTGGNSVNIINLSGGIASTNTRALVFSGTAGKTVLGASPNYTNGIFFGSAGSGLELISNTALGDTTGLTQIGGGSVSTGAVLLTGGLTGVQEFFDLDQRTTTAAHFKNESGTNVLSGALELENGGHTGSQYTQWALQSDGTAAGDLLKVTANVFSSTVEAVTATGSTLNLNGAGNGLISGNITDGPWTNPISLATGVNTFGITKANGGTWTLSGTNVYTGPTDIQGGKLLIDGKTTTVGQFTVENGATLGGHGTIVANVVVVPGGTYSPGNSVATQTITGNLAVAGALSIEYEGVGAGDNIDRTNVSGLLDLSAASLNFTDIGLGAPLDLSAYVFASYGTLSPLLGVPTGVPAGYHVDYHYNDGVSSNNVALVVPEPSVLSAAALGLVALKRRRR